MRDRGPSRHSTGLPRCPFTICLYYKFPLCPPPPTHTLLPSPPDSVQTSNCEFILFQYLQLHLVPVLCHSSAAWVHAWSCKVPKTTKGNHTSPTRLLHQLHPLNGIPALHVLLPQPGLLLLHHLRPPLPVPGNSSTLPKLAPLQPSHPADRKRDRITPDPHTSCVDNPCHDMHTPTVPQFRMSRCVCDERLRSATRGWVWGAQRRRAADPDVHVPGRGGRRRVRASASVGTHRALHGCRGLHRHHSRRARHSVTKHTSSAPRLACLEAASTPTVAWFHNSYVACGPCGTVCLLAYNLVTRALAFCGSISGCSHLACSFHCVHGFTCRLPQQRPGQQAQSQHKRVK